MAFKDISFFTSGVHFARRGTVCAILVEGAMRNTSFKLF